MAERRKFSLSACRLLLVMTIDWFLNVVGGETHGDRPNMHNATQLERAALTTWLHVFVQHLVSKYMLCGRDETCGVRLLHA